MNRMGGSRFAAAAARGCLGVALLSLSTVTLRAQPARIVSTAPSITEMLFALGLGGRVAGVTEYCRYPADALRVRKIGTYIQPNIEAILSLTPDLVVIQENPARLKEKFEAVGLNVLELRHTTVGDVYESIAILGRMTGAGDRATALNAEIRGRLDEIGRRTSRRPRRRMMLIVGRTPHAIEGLVAVGRASYLNELIAIAGGENVFAAAAAPYPKVSLEEVLARDPEVIVDMGEMADTVGVTDEQKRRVVELWRRYPNLAAVRRGAVFAVASDIFVVPGPRMVEAAAAFGRMLHPEAGW